MQTKQLRFALLIIGVLMVAFAAVRFVMGFFKTVQKADLPPPETGMFVSFSTEVITLLLGAAGVLLCVLSSVWNRDRA